MTPDDPRHGTTAGSLAHYADGEQACFACRVAKSQYGTEVHRLRAYGRWNPWAEAEPVRAHLRSLMDQGMSIKRIAEAVGVPYGRVGYVLYGRGQKPIPNKVRPDFAEKVLAVTAKPRLLNSCGSRRRVQALVAIGWTQLYIAERSNLPQTRIWDLLHGGLEQVTESVHQRIAATYDDLSMRVPPTSTRAEKYAASKARNTALRHGYLPPLAWDDDRLDDPNFNPSAHETVICKDADEIAVIRFLEGDRTVPTRRPERERIVAEYLRLGRPLAELERAGWKPERYMERRDGAA